MPSDCFSNVNSGDAESKCDTKGGTWPQTMCPHTSKKRSKPLVKSFGTKQSRKSSYTILEGPMEERCDEWTKLETNVSQSKVTSISGWKSSTKEERSTSASGWRRRRTFVVSLEGDIVFGANVHIIWAYSFTWARACVWCKCVDGGGIESRVDSENLWKVKSSALVMCFSCNAS